MELLSEHHASKYYDFDKNNVNIDFTTLTIGSNKQVWWACNKKHSFLMRVQNYVKTKRTTVCPYCANKELLTGYNDIATVHPELLHEWDYVKNTDNNINPEKLRFNDNHEVFWKCANNHSWTASPAYRHRGYGKCIRCVSLGENFPELLAEWDYDKNTVDPFLVRYGSGEKIWWIGQECGHSWESKLRKGRVEDNQNCPYCSGQRIFQGFNDLATMRPDLARLWSPKNAKKATETGTSGKRKNIWTDDCGHEWKNTIDVMKKHVDPSCPMCKSIIFTHPKIVKQFHHKKNKNIDIRQLTAGSDKKVWWKHDDCGHEWIQSLWSRTNNESQCQICVNKQILIGFNDLPTLKPELFKEWHKYKNALDPYTLTIGSGRKVWWKCLKNHEWQAVVSDRVRGSQCPNCSARQQTSKAEKEIAEFLKDNNQIIIQNSRNLLQGRKELDIFIPEKNIAIEFNGLYWHSDATGTEKEYHYNKWKQCQDKGIQLITIWEDDWKNKKNLVKQMLAHKIGFSDQDKLYARKTVVRTINKKVADDFLNNNHIQGSTDGSIRLGLHTKDSDEMVAVMVFKKRSGDEVELMRYATLKVVVGGFTKLLKYFESSHDDDTCEKIVTFDDHTVSDEGLYVNNGFVHVVS